MNNEFEIKSHKKGGKMEGRSPDGKFMKGWKGGTGRPAIPEDYRDMIKNYGMEGVQFMYRTMNNSKAPLFIRVRCAAELADRGLGKAVQSVNVEKDEPINIILNLDTEGI